MSTFSVRWDEQERSHVLDGSLDDALRSLPKERFAILAMRSGQYGLWAVTIGSRSHGVTEPKVTGIHEEFEAALRRAIGEFMAAEGRS